MAVTGYQFTYYNSNWGSYCIAPSAPAGTQFLLGMRGFGLPNVEIPMQRAPYTDGATVIGPSFAWPPTATTELFKPIPYTEPRTMELAVGIEAASAREFQAAYEDMLAGLTPYAPMTTGYPSYLYILLPYASGFDGIVREIDCYCTGVSSPEMDGPCYGVVTISFLAPYPFFRAADDIDASHTDWAPGTNPKTIENVGHAPLWPHIAVVGSAASTIVGLHITNTTTGEVFSINQTIALGTDYSVHIYMEKGQIEYRKTGGGAFNTDIITKMDTDAVFWALILGNNVLQWSSTSGTPSAITVYHPWRYLGI